MAAPLHLTRCLCTRKLLLHVPASSLRLSSVNFMHFTRSVSRPNKTTMISSQYRASKIPHQYSVISRSLVTTAGGEEFPVEEDLTEREQEAVEKLFYGLCKGERSSLARSITLIETVNERKKLQAALLLKMVLEEDRRRKKHTLSRTDSFRIGLSGPPGAGKSTFIEAFGKFLTAQDHKVAVLAVDPSSSTTGGSLLGDKTRMPELTVDPNAYIRPSPAGGTLGGVTRCTNDAIVLSEGAGYDIILVETVGVGQSEFAVANMVDMFILLIPPAGGDELQGIKKGIVEVADLVVINKADGDLIPAARRIQTEYTSALKFVRRKKKKWRPKVMRVSSIKKDGIPELWTKIQEFREKMETSGDLELTRQKQHTVWMWNQISANILDMFREHPSVKPHVERVEAQVGRSAITPGQGADYLLHKFGSKNSKD